MSWVKTQEYFSNVCRKFSISRCVAWNLEWYMCWFDNERIYRHVSNNTKYIQSANITPGWILFPNHGKCSIGLRKSLSAQFISHPIRGENEKKWRVHSRKYYCSKFGCPEENLRWVPSRGLIQNYILLYEKWPQEKISKNQRWERFTFRKDQVSSAWPESRFLYFQYSLYCKQGGWPTKQAASHEPYSTSWTRSRSP